MTSTGKKTLTSTIPPQTFLDSLSNLTEVKPFVKQKVQPSTKVPPSELLNVFADAVRSRGEDFKDLSVASVFKDRTNNARDQLAGALKGQQVGGDELNEEDENEAEDFVNLPTIKCPPLAQAGEHSSTEEINRQHLQMSNLELNVIYAMWSQVNSISSVCKLIGASIQAVKHQRDLLCLPYGYRGEASRKDIIFPPLED